MLLIVSATVKEIGSLAQALGAPAFAASSPGQLVRHADCAFLITGVGQLLTAYWLSRTLETEGVSAVLNLGIAGSFTDDFPPTSVVRVTHEILGDLGAETDDRDLDLFQMKLLDSNQSPFRDGMLINIHSDLLGRELSALPAVRSVTLNKALSGAASISRITAKYSAHIVNMEGAAVFYACLVKGVPFQEIRAVSDMAGTRDKSRWNIEGAIESLRDAALPIIEQIK